MEKTAQIVKDIRKLVEESKNDSLENEIAVDQEKMMSLLEKFEDNWMEIGDVSINQALQDMKSLIEYSPRIPLTNIGIINKAELTRLLVELERVLAGKGGRY